jgi:hypothetical protein
MGGEWQTAKAMTKLDDAQSIIPIAEQYGQSCKPATDAVRTQRLTALGMTMAPNRQAAEASIWLHETKRLLSDLPADILCHAIDTLQKRLKFLPTVAEIREVADPIIGRRRREFSRLDAMRRYVESGQPIPKRIESAIPAAPQHKADEPMTAEHTEEMNAIFAKIGAATRYRPDGSRYQVAEAERQQRIERGPLRKPTRQDYIELGVDPATIDRIMAEQRAA